MNDDAHRLDAYIQAHPFDSGDSSCETVLDQIYQAYVVLTERVQKLPDVAKANRFFNYPYVAIEEALSNAVYHKGYDIREPIEVRVLPARIEILSHPGVDRSISIEGQNPTGCPVAVTAIAESVSF